MSDHDQPKTRIGDSPQKGDVEAFDDPRVLQIVKEYQTELEAGRFPDRREYLERYPELASVISECLDGLELVHRVAPSSVDFGKSSPAERRARRDLLLPGTDVTPAALGDFQIVRELDRGGMGIVYEAVQLSLGRRVALKVLPFAATLDERQLQRFKNEAQAAAQLHHRSIVPIYAFGCERGVHFYAMQLIDGQSLAAVIRDLRQQAGIQPKQQPNSSDQVLEDQSEPAGSKAIKSQPKDEIPLAERSTQVVAAVTDGAVPYREGSFRRIAKLMVQAAEALDHAHQSGVVHRDVKPGNLLINGTGNLWVADFGLAQFQADTGLTRTGDLLGTIRYMSPEQTTGGRTPLDHRTDIYSLGATFYELLTLQPLFDGETRAELLYGILQCEPQAPRSHNPSIPVELETILLKCLSKSAADRYSSAADLASDLQRYLQHQPILARRPTLVDWSRKWARRHPSIVISAILLMTVITIGLTVSTWLVTREQQRTAEAYALEKQRSLEALKSYERARAAVDLLIEQSEHELSDSPGAQGTRQRLLEAALTYYQDFIDQHEGKPDKQKDLTKERERVKHMLHELAAIQREMQLNLLHAQSVQTDLKLSSAQKSQLVQLLKGWSAEHQKTFGSSTTISESDRRRQRAETVEKFERELEGVLTASQRKRIKQIELQVHGLFAFKDQNVVKALRLTDEQVAAIREIERSMFDRRGMGPPIRVEFHGEDKDDDKPDEDAKNLFPEGAPQKGIFGRFGQGGFSLAAHRRESVARVVAVLSADQVQTWKEMIGPPFEGLDDDSFRGPHGIGRFPGPHGPMHHHEKWKSSPEKRGPKNADPDSDDDLPSPQKP